MGMVTAVGSSNSGSGGPSNSSNGTASRKLIAPMINMEENNMSVPISHGVNFNYVHYDPEIHWCSVCSVFPKSAKDYLNHLHSAEHRLLIQEKQINEAPWHKSTPESEIPSNKEGPVKRIPIKGNVFLVFQEIFDLQLLKYVWLMIDLQLHDLIQYLPRSLS